MLNYNTLYIHISTYIYWYYTSCWLTVAALQSKANLHTIGSVPHNRDGEVGANADAEAEVDNSVTCAFDSLTRALQEEPHIPFETAIVVTILIVSRYNIQSRLYRVNLISSHELDYGQSHKRSVADALLKRGGTPILFALLGLTAKNWSAASIDLS